MFTRFTRKVNLLTRYVGLKRQKNFSLKSDRARESEKLVPVSLDLLHRLMPPEEMAKVVETEIVNVIDQHHHFHLINSHHLILVVDIVGY